jgi:integrase
MAKVRLSKRTIDALAWEPDGPAQQFAWDDGLSGFGAYVLETGRKVFVAQFRTGGKSRRITIGRYGVLTVEQAREKAREILATVALEGDYKPVEAQEAPIARTIADVAEEFFEHVSALRKPSTAAEYRRNLSKQILPPLGGRALADIKTADLMQIHKGLNATPYLANRTMDAFASMWAYASSVGIVDAAANPTRALKRYRESGRERFLSPAEMARVGDALRTVEAERRIDLYAVAALKLLLLSGARLKEVLHAQWGWLDEERGILNLPDSKTGKKPVLLSAPALAILEELPRIDGNPHIFPGRKPGAPKSSLFDVWKIVRAEAGLPDVRIHDLRHSHASVGAGEGVALQVIGKLLGHSKPQTTARYAHLSDDPVRAASDAIGQRISESLNATPAKAKNKTTAG